MWNDVFMEFSMVVMSYKHYHLAFIGIANETSIFKVMTICMTPGWLQMLVRWVET